MAHGNWLPSDMVERIRSHYNTRNQATTSRNRNADGSRSDTINRVFVVTDATKDSTFGDICWSADPVTLAKIMVGAGGYLVVEREHWTFYSNARSAAEAAYERMEAAGALVEKNPADLTRLRA